MRRASARWTAPRTAAVVLGLVSLAVAVALPLVAWSQDTDTDGGDDGETVTVWSDNFKRWDGTRWLVKTEIGDPMPFLFLADRNFEYLTHMFQIRTILACDKDFKETKHRWQVHCKVEDFAIQSTVRKATPPYDPEKVQSILDEIDGKVTGADMQLLVTGDGRVVDIDMEGVAKDREREATMAETLRQVMSRVIVGFDMKLQKYDTLKPGAWVEYHSALMTMPAITEAQGMDPAAMGNSVVMDKLSRMDGRIVVESRGKGIVSYDSNYFDTRLDSVAVYNGKDGYMTERVWILRGDLTPSSALMAGGGQAPPYWHAGHILQLQPDEHPDLGPTRIVYYPKLHDPDGVAADWQALDPEVMPDVKDEKNASLFGR